LQKKNSVSEDFSRIVQERSKQNVFSCYQCLKCSNGCPVTFAMDYLPHQVIRMVQLGMQDELLRSSTIWVCASCETCATRCPNDIEITRVMDILRQLSVEKGLVDKEKGPFIFHKLFLDSIKRYGRVYELELVGLYRLKTRNLFEDLKLGWDMFRKGKLKLFPHSVKAKKEIKEIFKAGEKV